MSCRCTLVEKGTDIRAPLRFLVVPVCLGGAVVVIGYLLLAPVLRSNRTREPVSSESKESERSSSSNSNDDAWFADPRLTYPSAFKNTRPGVAYVGDAVCARCHSDLSDRYHQHPMGRSAFLPADIPDDELADAEHGNPFEAQGIQYRVRREGSEIWHDARILDPNDSSRELARISDKIAVAIGSGSHSRSYLVEHDGFLFESPMTWYGQKQRWDLSPGYQKSKSPVLFDREINSRCLYCHVDHVDLTAGRLNHYEGKIFQGAIGCERCHGPGELHARARADRSEVQGLDDTIVNPRRLSAALREQICQQCHLQAEVVLAPGRTDFDYRPGLPMFLFADMYIMPEKATTSVEIVGQVEHMYSSRCFRESNRLHEDDPSRALGCTTCHDPHQTPSPANVVSHYRKACLKCHEKEQPACSMPLSARLEKQADDSCIACHMPKRAPTKIPHFVLTDHRILRDKNKPPPPFTPRALSTEEPPLVSFFDGADGYGGELSRRARAIACVLKLDSPNTKGSSVNTSLKQYAIENLGDIVRAHPRDAEAGRIYAFLLASSGQGDEGVRIIRNLLNEFPDDESLLRAAALVAGISGHSAMEIDCRQTLIALNPFNQDQRRRLIQNYFSIKNWPGIVEQARVVLERNPAELNMEKVYVRALRRSGRKQEAEAEFDKLLRMHPDQAEALQKWWTGG